MFGYKKINLKIIKKMLQVSLVKTLRFNLHYFGLKGLQLPILVSKYTKLARLEGQVLINSPSFGCVHIGFDGVDIFDLHYERTIWNNCGTIIFNNCATLGLATRISCAGILNFGKSFRLTAHSSIICNESIQFGDDTLVSWNCSFMDTDFHKIFDTKGNVLNINKPISIGNNVWICSNSTILKGTYIGDNNIVACGTLLVGKKISAKNNIIGSSGIILKENISWKP